MDQVELSPEAAQAVHDVKNAQHSVEVAREVQAADLVAKTKQETKQAIVEALQDIFGGPNIEDPEHMTIIYQKIPILCIRVDNIDKNIVEIKASMLWFTRAALGAVVTGVVGLIIVAATKFIYG